MKNKKLAIIVGVLLIIILFTIILLSTKPEKHGNTNGNLYNYGIAANKDNKVYYLGFNKYSPDGIYKVKKSGKKTEKISEDYGAYININGNYMYYVDMENYNLVKVKTNGKNEKTLVEAIDQLPITVFKGWVYYSKDEKLYRIKTNGNKEERILNKSAQSYQIVNGSIYYTYYDAGEYVLSKMKLDGSNAKKIGSDIGTVFHVEGNTLYYLYKNNDYIYELHKMKANGKNKERITEMGEDIDDNYINMTNKGIYYLGATDDGKQAIYFVKYNGKDKRKVVDIEIYSTPINVIDNYIFYTDIDDNSNMNTYKIKTNGKDKVQL